MDDVAIWRRALTADDVALIYESGVDGVAIGGTGENEYSLLPEFDLPRFVYRSEINLEVTERRYYTPTSENLADATVADLLNGSPAEMASCRAQEADAAGTLFPRDFDVHIVQQGLTFQLLLSFHLLNCAILRA